jgi:hypothetical protein
MTVIPTTQMTRVPSSAGTSEADAVDRGVRTAHEAVGDDEHQRLHRHPADQVACRNIQMAAGDRADGDRQFGKGAGDRQQDHATDRLAETEAVVEHVGRLRQPDAGDPRRDRSASEEKQQRGYSEMVHCSCLLVRPWTCRCLLTSNDVDMLSASISSLPADVRRASRAMQGDAKTSAPRACREICT